MLVDNQIIPVYKPLYYSSFDVIRYLRREFGVKKIGHAGTLDPLAEGLLLVCTGRATKQINSIMGLPKEYIMELTFGAETASGDRETAPENPRSIAHLTGAMIGEVLKNFEGEIEQYPPLYSAVKRNGRRLYEYARAGEQVEIPSRIVQIHSIDLLQIDLPQIEARVACSKGTYIRSLARDIGEALDCGAYLSKLRRTKIGDFCVEKALQILPERPEWQAKYSPQNSTNPPHWLR